LLFSTSDVIVIVTSVFKTVVFFTSITKVSNVGLIDLQASKLNGPIVYETDEDDVAIAT